MKIQKLLFNKIKQHLTDNYGLDMFSADIRFAYVIYNVIMQEYHDIMTFRLILVETYTEYINKDIAYSAFEKSVFRTFNKIGTDKKAVEVVMSIAEKIEF